MLRNPKVGDRVQVWYRTTRKGGLPAPSEFMPWHGHFATVMKIGRGPGPRNVMVNVTLKAVRGGTIFCTSETIVVPRGNLRRVE